MSILPDWYFRRITDIPVSFLRREGIEGCILDIDNTLTFDNDERLPDETAVWLKNLSEAGISAVIVSNNSGERASKFAALCGLPFVGRAAKPGTWSLRRVFAALGTKPENTAVIGDQLFTDVLYGKNARCRTVLVERMGDDIPLFVRLKRVFEKPAVRTLGKRGYTQP